MIYFTKASLINPVKTHTFEIEHYMLTYQQERSFGMINFVEPDETEIKIIHKC